MITGSFGDYNTWLSWIFLITSIIICQIVLLNLLIAIVNDTFDRIKGNYNVIMYKDMLELMYENEFLDILRIVRLSRIDAVYRNKYIFLSVPVNDTDQDLELHDKITSI